MKLLIFVAADADYQIVRAKAKAAEESFNMASAELDGLLTLMEHTDQVVQNLSQQAEAAKEDTETLPGQIEELKEKIAAFTSLYSAFQ